MKKYHPTLIEAKKAFRNEYGFNYKDSPPEYHIRIYDLKKTYPKRKVRRFFIGSHIEWLNFT